MNTHKIIKYANRKLYWTQKHRYTTLAEVANLIADNQTVQITDHQTGKCVLNNTLKQIVASEKFNFSSEELLSIISLTIKKDWDNATA